MPKSVEEKIPYNLLSLISELGEGMVLFKLYEKSIEYPELEVYKNFSEVGYDLGLRNNENGNKVKIEVKTRQRLLTTSKDDNVVHFPKMSITIPIS